ncbi:redoxin domain-containing protein [Arundinibacter roseus]|uniref:Redoxin domain-containing protein n=1 Tax=Arundinibacter roseus TaxID=2070510 RepID=A0A4R4K9L1_9BACT|nr:redoxin domain-containing protein [Arundinibacter roseus]TDB64504.1 redoxin domain-containing protein [Arundinibacter roseus]
MSCKIGEKAPEFSLFNSEKKLVNLTDFAGKNLIIHFFPMAFTGVCTTQLCTLRDDIESYKNMNAEVVAISVDSPFALAKFKEQENYSFDLLSDFNKSTSESYGAIYEEFVFGLKGVSKRAAFVVDKEGVVQYAEVLDNAGELPNFGKIKETLTAL